MPGYNSTMKSQILEGSSKWAGSCTTDFLRFTFYSGKTPTAHLGSKTHANFKLMQQSCMLCKSMDPIDWVFPKWAELSLNLASSGNLINHWSINWYQFREQRQQDMWETGGSILVSYTRGGWVAGSSPFTIMTNILLTEFSKFSETFRKNSIAPIRFSRFLKFFVVDWIDSATELWYMKVW